MARNRRIELSTIIGEDSEFIGDLKVELEKIQTIDGIPFDTAYLWIKIRKN